MSDPERNVEIIREFVAAWSRLDAPELAAYFTEDGVYHNMPAAPVSGRAAIEQFIRGFTGPWTETTWDLVHVVGVGDLVFAERLDRTQAADGKGVDLPCIGVFEMQDGKIRVWRDYFDMATYVNQLSALTGGANSS
jgi:limonene-1,2-epoxide hydrolase